VREGTDGMEKGKRNREEANSAKGKGQASGELDPKISPTQGGAVRRIWAKGRAPKQECRFIFALAHEYRYIILERYGRHHNAAI
jgi:hypothetical protein